jgi:hypothetical protein
VRQAAEDAREQHLGVEAAATPALIDAVANRFPEVAESDQ